VDTFKYVEVDKNSFQNIREVDAIVECGGTIKFNALTSLKVSAELPFVGDFDLGNNYLRVYSTSWFGGQEINLCHATLIASRPATSYTGTSTTGALECYSLLKLLEDTAIEEPLTYTAGADPVGQATLLISKVGLPFIASSTTMKLSTPRSYEAGTSYLEICNDLLGAAGFCELDIDSLGNVRISKYTDPAYRLPVWTLRDDDKEVVFGAEVSHELDTFDVPNKVIAVMSNVDKASMIATATNTDPTSVFSTVQRGRTIAHVEKVSDVESQSALTDVAKRVLAEKSSAVESITIEHPFLPFNTGDALALVYTKHQLEFSGIAVSKELLLKRGMFTKTCIRRFVRR